METWGSGGIAPPFLTSALEGVEWSAPRPSRVTRGERAPGTHRVGGWVGGSSWRIAYLVKHRDKFTFYMKCNTGLFISP
jgi:hypothetical protein